MLSQGRSVVAHLVTRIVNVFSLDVESNLSNVQASISIRVMFSNFYYEKKQHINQEVTF